MREKKPSAVLITDITANRVCVCAHVDRRQLNIAVEERANVSGLGHGTFDPSYPKRALITFIY